MAENEYLDIGKSHRWRRVYDAVRDGRPLDEIIRLFEVCLRKVLKALRKPLFEGGPPQVPLRDLLEAFKRGPEAMDRVVQRCQGHDYALLFQDASCGARSRTEAMEQFLSAVCEKICDQIEHRIVCPDGQRTFSQTRSTLDQVEAGLKPEISRLAGQLVANPESQLRPRGKHTPALDTRSILNESLLGLAMRDSSSHQFRVHLIGSGPGGPCNIDLTLGRRNDEEE